MPYCEWNPRFVHSGMALQERVNGKVYVVWIGKGAHPTRNQHVLYDAWVDDHCVYRAADEFKVSQRVNLNGSH